MAEGRSVSDKWRRQVRFYPRALEASLIEEIFWSGATLGEMSTVSPGPCEAVVILSHKTATSPSCAAERCDSSSQTSANASPQPVLPVNS